MTKPWLVVGLALIGACYRPQSRVQIPARYEGPIVDAHLHAFAMSWAAGMDTAWWPRSIPRSTTDSGLRNETVRMLRANGVVKAVASGFSMATVNDYVSAADDLIVPALMFGATADPDTIRNRFLRGAIKVLGEVTWQYGGLSPSDTSLDKFWRLAEELDAPMGVHLGLGPPEFQLHGSAYRMALSDPLQLEAALVRHPRARVYVMHAGWPMGDRMVGLLYSFPRVYVDVSVINWFVPRSEFHGYLKRLVDAGYADRIMYGSDQMIWPSSIPIGIEAINSAPFLTETQRSAIFCDNAVRFFRLDQQICRR